MKTMTTAEIGHELTASLKELRMPTVREVRFRHRLAGGLDQTDIVHLIGEQAIELIPVGL